ncbi:hypothetical protein PFISCL1PPCAC_22334, partial [Pristionchus fissidentatus]
LKRVTGLRVNPKCDFSSPSNLSDVIFIVEGQAIHASRQYLSSVSGVFRSMLDGGGREIVMDGVKYEEFTNFLDNIYPTFNHCYTVDEVGSLFKLATRFDIKFLRKNLIKFAEDSCGFFPEMICWHVEHGVKGDCISLSGSESFLSPTRALSRIENCADYKEMTAEKKNEVLKWIINNAHRH